MGRVLVIGSGGAGKTTVAIALAEATSLPLIHLDGHYWRSGWEPTPPEEWRRVVDRGTSRPSFPAGCPDRLTLQVLHWIWSYPSSRRPGILKRLRELGADTTVHVLRGDPEIEAFLAKAREAREPGRR